MAEIEIEGMIIGAIVLAAICYAVFRTIKEYRQGGSDWPGPQDC